MGKIILPSRSNKTPVSASPTKQEKKALSTASRENATSSLTKNQQFKLTKMDHNLINDKLINPNNCVIWSHDSGYVFMTGIWRLYQDVMKGLINLPRSDSVSTSQQQFFCKAEFEKILSFAFTITVRSLLRNLQAYCCRPPPLRRQRDGNPQGLPSWTPMRLLHLLLQRRQTITSIFIGTTSSPNCGTLFASLTKTS